MGLPTLHNITIRNDLDHSFPVREALNFKQYLLLLCHLDEALGVCSLSGARENN